MKKALNILAVYVFTLPIISDIIGFFFEHSKIKYIVQHPFSYIFETLFSGGTLLIPFLVLLGLAHINLFRKKPNEKYYYPNRIATICTAIFVVVGATLINIIWFLNLYLGIKERIWATIAIYGPIPAISVVMVLIVYGIGFMVSWLIKLQTKTTQVVP